MKQTVILCMTMSPQQLTTAFYVYENAKTKEYP